MSFRRVSNGSTENGTLEQQSSVIKSKNRPQRKVKFDKSYLDFMEDDPNQILLDEAFPSDGTNPDWSSGSETSSEIGDSEKGKGKLLLNYHYQYYYYYYQSNTYY